MTNTAGVVDTDHEAACHGTIRWWEPLFVVPVVACLSWLIVSCSLGFIVGALFAARGYDYTEVTAFESKVSTKFLVIQISMTIFYLAALFAIRHVLRKHRGRAWFAGYFRPIGIRPVLQAMLSGLVLAGVFLLAIVGLSQTPLWDLDPAAVNVTLQPRSLDQLAMSGLVTVVLIVPTEEIYFRGLLLDWCRQILAPLPSALITAAMFSLAHFQFLLHPGIAGWLATGAIAGLGVINALWVQRTGSLRAPVATHATYNATLMLAAFLVR